MILAPRPPFRASRRPPVGRHQGFQQAYRTTVSPDFGILGFWDYRVLRAAPRATVQGVPGKGFPGVPTRLGIPARLFRASLRVGRQAGKPAPGQSPLRLSPKIICGNMLHLSDWHRKVRPQSSWWPSAGRTTRKTFSRDWKKSIEEISPREWEKFQERHPETISIGKRERGAEPG